MEYGSKQVIKMRKLLNFIVAIPVLLSSCQHGEILDLEITSIPLQRDSIDIYAAWTIYEDSNGIYFMAKKQGESSVLLYKETTDCFRFMQSFAFPQAYLDTMKDEIHSDKFQLIPVNLDSLIIYTRHTISLLDLKNGILLKHFAYNHDSENVIIVDRAGPLKWNHERNVLPVMIVRFDKTGKKWEWDTEFAAEFSIESGELNIIPVIYPKEKCYTNYILSGMHQEPFITYGKGQYVFGFEGSPTLLIYDPQKNITDSIQIINPLYKPFPDYYDTLKLRGEVAYLQQMIRSATFDYYHIQMAYDPYNNVYYRFFLQDLSEKNENGKKNEYSDKKIGFSVINDRFQVIGDGHWEMKKANSSAWYPTSRGIYGFSHGCIGENCQVKRLGNIIKINWKKK